MGGVLFGFIFVSFRCFLCCLSSAINVTIGGDRFGIGCKNSWLPNVVFGFWFFLLSQNMANWNGG